MFPNGEKAKRVFRNPQELYIYRSFLCQIYFQRDFDLQQQNEVGFFSPSNQNIEGSKPRDQNAPPVKGKSRDKVIVISLPFAPSFVSSVSGVGSGGSAAGGSGVSGGGG